MHNSYPISDQSGLSRALDLILRDQICNDHEANAVLAELRAGNLVPDARFDSIFPDYIRTLSQRHWTPVEVAVRAAQLLVVGPRVRVLDIGSGAGKFCTIGALTTSGIFTGIEQRGFLVDAARSVASWFDLHNIRYEHGNARDLDWDQFEAFYFFNPFYEHIDDSARIDQSLTFDETRFRSYVSVVRDKLDQTELGTRVVTYHGFGGEMPASFTCTVREPYGEDFLQLWVKTKDSW